MAKKISLIIIFIFLCFMLWALNYPRITLHYPNTNQFIKIRFFNLDDNKDQKRYLLNGSMSFLTTKIQPQEGDPLSIDMVWSLYNSDIKTNYEIFILSGDDRNFCTVDIYLNDDAKIIDIKKCDGWIGNFCLKWPSSTLTTWIPGYPW